MLAFQALPLVLLVSALSAMLYHWRVLPAVVSGFAWCLRRTLGLGGTAGVATAANVFVGMIEAPLLVKPYLARATRADLFVVMTAGMATIAGTVMVLYAQFLQGVVPGAIGHLLTASILNAPAAIVIARLMVPAEPGAEADRVEMAGIYDSTMDALTQGTADGLRLLLNIVAMLIVLVALVALIDMILGLAPHVAGAPLSLERLFGWALSPVAWAIGIPWKEAGIAGELIGTKVVLNELLAYLQMSHIPATQLSATSKLILTYGMCGFANFGSLGIMLGGLTAMAPERRGDIVSLGLKSIMAGVIATLLDRRPRRRAVPPVRVKPKSKGPGLTGRAPFRDQRRYALRGDQAALALPLPALSPARFITPSSRLPSSGVAGAMGRRWLFLAISPIFHIMYLMGIGLVS